jgi:ATP-dependent helicase Lhr and Lhr-like helicase
VRGFFCLPPPRPGTRTPLWQQRQRAADLLAVASKHGSFPILLETYRECLRDAFDVPALVELMTKVRARELRVVSVDTGRPSPFATSLAFAYVANFLYEGDAPLAERKAQALTLDRDLLAELLGAEELRELIQPSALADLEAHLQCLDERRWARHPDAAHDQLRRLGDLSRDELAARSTDDFADELLAERRAVLVRVAGEERLIAAEDAGRYRDALGAGLPAGLPDAFLEPVDDPLGSLLGRWARTHPPFGTGEPAARFGLPVALVDDLLARRAEGGQLLRGEFRPDGTEREWCDPEVLRQLRQRSLAALRKQVEPVEAVTLGRFLPAWQGVGSSARGIGRLIEVVSQLQGVPIPASALERDVLSSRVADYSPGLLDQLATAGEVVWVGAGPVGRDDGKVMLFLRRDAGILRPLTNAGDRPESEEHDRLRAVLQQRGACFFRELAGAGDSESLDALWDLVWAGEVTNDSFAPLRALTARKSRSSGSGGRRGKPNLGSLSVLGPPKAQGRWSLVESDLPRDDAVPTERSMRLASVLLDRHGVLTRESVRGEGHAGGFAAVYPVLRAMEEAGRARRGYFVAGLGGAQFALAGAVDRLRARPDDDAEPTALVLAATDPANPYGVALPWPVKGPQRAAGAYVSFVDGVASLYLERGGRSVVTLRPYDGSWEGAAVEALGGLVAEGRLRRLALERFDEELSPVLRSAGFVPSPRGLVRYG